MTCVSMNESFRIGDSASCKVYPVLVDLHAVRNSFHAFRNNEGCAKPRKWVENNVTLLGKLFNKILDQGLRITDIIIPKIGWKWTVVSARKMNVGFH